MCAGCADNQEPREASGVGSETTEVTADDTPGSTADANPERNAYFGDLHVHTANSFDAFVLGTLLSPDDAYRFAKGEAFQHPAGFEMKIREPLDFYAVTDHAFFLGITRAMADPAEPNVQTSGCQGFDHRGYAKGTNERIPRRRAVL